MLLSLYSHEFKKPSPYFYAISIFLDSSFIMFLPVFLMVYRKKEIFVIYLISLSKKMIKNQEKRNVKLIPVTNSRLLECLSS